MSGSRKKTKLRIELGEAAWRRFTYERAAGDRLRLLGSISRGMEIGALARADGGYLMLVGDYETNLKSHDVDRVLTKIKADRSAGGWQTLGHSVGEKKAVVVVVKKRRVVDRSVSS